MRQVVFVHGRSQQGKDAGTLKAEWIDAWAQGLRACGLSLPVVPEAIRFPFYGDALDGLVQGHGDVADVIVRGAQDDAVESALLLAVLTEAAERAGITTADVRRRAQQRELERGPAAWTWVRALIATLDERLPAASGTTLALLTTDVWRYLRDPGIRATIEDGVEQALPLGTDSIVVGHSLGSVIAYSLLRRRGERAGWRIPLLVTLGSPLGVQAIRNRLRPVGHPSCVTAWLNAMDARDIVALRPLGPPWFAVEPPVENWTGVRNDTPGRHGIAGYLADPEVARRIHAAFVS